jgi:predicted RNA binding protein YcfA (HicA-like mRNA interferase family)
VTISQVQETLLKNSWSVVRHDGLVRTFVENGSENLITVAGEDDDTVPDLALNDIRWIVGTL